ncbi:10119_t:CDS:2 [Acaulospora colombiana]|uniref:10119_t:CDS:1 n=1 Tax=Acaulospora colombiana TaxID=27376 RepID=A0ACA9NCG5_9GLOM|nr:10119_t:CDS:2 [Acaulospora colombiana]
MLLRTCPGWLIHLQHAGFSQLERLPISLLRRVNSRPSRPYLFYSVCLYYDYTDELFYYDCSSLREIDQGNTALGVSQKVRDIMLAFGQLCRQPGWAQPTLQTKLVPSMGYGRYVTGALIATNSHFRNELIQSK